MDCNLESNIPIKEIRNLFWKSKNTGWQSICNSIGMGTGGFLGGALFLTLESEKFANQFVRPALRLEPRNYGIITIRSTSQMVYFIKTDESFELFLFS